MTALPTPRPCTEGSTALTDEVEVPLAVVERLRGEPSGADYDVAGGLGGVDPMVPFEVVVEEFGFVCDLRDPPEVAGRKAMPAAVLAASLMSSDEAASPSDSEGLVDCCYPCAASVPNVESGANAHG